MDEATSQVDSKTEVYIEEAIKDVFRESTVIKIAHRLENILDYDKVVVLDKGQMVEVGRPSVLKVNKDSKFYQLLRNAKLA